LEGNLGRRKRKKGHAEHARVVCCGGDNGLGNEREEGTNERRLIWIWN